MFHPDYPLSVRHVGALLCDVMDDLYTQQLHANVVDSQIIAHIHDVRRITHSDGRFFDVQLNPYRAQRGISPTPHPNPKHMIPFKGGIPCFLCMENIVHQWPEERGYPFRLTHKQWVFLPNIAPLFPHHFTVTTADHLPGDIDCEALFNLASLLPEYWVIQNGAGAGATNPWHLHLQCFKAALPITSVPASAVSVSPIPGVSQIQRIHLPGSIFRLLISNPFDALPPISELIARYAARNSRHAMNVLCRTIKDENQHSTPILELTIALRHQDIKTPRYKTGQPGYAEIGGMIAVVRPEDWDRWMDAGYSAYETLLWEIAYDEGADLFFA